MFEDEISVMTKLTSRAAVLDYRLETNPEGNAETLLGMVELKQPIAAKLFGSSHAGEGITRNERHSPRTRVEV